LQDEAPLSKPGSAGESLQFFIALHDEAALLLSISPGQTHEMLFRLGKQHECADSEAEDGESNGCTDASVYVLAVGNLGNGRYGNCYKIALVMIDPNLIWLDEEFDVGTCFDTRQRPAVVAYFVAVIRGEGCSRNQQAKEECQKQFHMVSFHSEIDA
jgi:hypothetical protein